MGQGTNLFFSFFFRNFVLFCVFCVVFMFPNVSKQIKKWIGGGWVWPEQSEFFSDFWILTPNTSVQIHVSDSEGKSS